MSDRESNLSVWGFIKGFGKLMIGLLLLLQGLIGLFVMLMFVGIMVSVANGVAGNNDKVSVSIPNGGALLLNPNGVLVEQSEDIDPFEIFIEEAYGRNQPTQIEVHDLVRVVRKAKTDDRIKGIVLDLGALQVPGSSASKMHYLVDELRQFKESGKKIIAIGDYYSQDQYLLAANADEIHMNDYGNVIIYGYGRYSTFVKTFLEKLKITSHVFRVGTFKSAVEPFMRDDMSPEAKEANQAYLDVLWENYVTSVEQSRGLAAGSIRAYADNFTDITRAADGDFAEAAKQSGLIDNLTSRAEQNARLIELFGKSKDGEGFKHAGFRRYLNAIDQNNDDSDPNIAVVTAAGTIVDGEAPAGQAAGGDTIASLLKKARKDDNVKAVVLRVDSPGGSAFASDIIRDELLAIKAAGKPVVASMGSLAASGGYWISAPADEIWAAPTTITGSIGIFGYFNTFENTAAEIGVFVDGVGTTQLSPILATGIGPLPQSASEIIQASIEHGYDRFLTIVGEGRDLDKDYVDSIGQGRVWIGARAQELRLVDNIGDIDDAIASAAKLAQLEKYDVVEMVERKTPFELILGNMSMAGMKLLGIDERMNIRRNSAIQNAMSQAEKQLEFFNEFNDPNATYARCLNC
ncbi:MAG: signal peptide peptidase SppA [Marinicaulis sp.]|nr:signal peptide peptidase SppA [Marinicaulis sp.]NNE40453.1 signal peptide peptidase SppA [Marinicaulis sp.]NNL88554.1 signal peptide peptidase SppA [Marinicaulis sp.]